MVGSALLRRLRNEDCTIVTASRKVLDLRDAKATRDWLALTRPDTVFCAAAHVGGIHANNARPADFIRDNIEIQASVIHGAYQAGVEKLVFLGSSCIYPREAPQPIPEAALLTGPLEPTNQWYAIAKIAGILQCRAYRRQYGCDYISAMPSNLYGPGDNYHPTDSHVVGALIQRFHEAKTAGYPEVKVWGSGRPRREFLHVDDCADALVFLARHYSDEEHVNIGSGTDLTIAALADLVARTVGYEGRFDFDRSQPDGTPRKLLDVRKLNELGWRPRIGLAEGLADAYADYRDGIAAMPDAKIA